MRTGRSIRIAAAVALWVMLALVGNAGISPASAAPQRYLIDKDHTSVGFLVSHIGFSKVLGQFSKAEGSFVFDEDKPMVTDIQIVIDAASVDTRHAARDDHLRKEDFLWVEKYPTITFRGTGAEQTGPRTGKVTGDLILRGVSRPVTLDVTWNKSGEYPIGDKHFATGV